MMGGQHTIVDPTTARRIIEWTAAFTGPSIDEWGESEFALANGSVEDDDRIARGVGPLVYYVSAGVDGPVKIGFTHDLHRRLRQLQTGSPKKLLVLAAEVGSSGMEAVQHRSFEAFRAHGEWFQPHPLLLAYIRDLRAARDRRTLDGLRSKIAALVDLDVTFPTLDTAVLSRARNHARPRDTSREPVRDEEHDSPDADSRKPAGCE